LSHARSTHEVVDVIDRHFQYISKELAQIGRGLSALRERQLTLDKGRQPVDSVVGDALVCIMRASSVMAAHAELLQSFATQTAIEGLDDDESDR